MTRSDSAGDPPIQLERNKQIDAICDRFELAWDTENRPRIEEYLELLPAADRRLLLGELLASELALRGRQQAVCDRGEYADRFPEYLDIVTEVFKRRRPEPAQESAAIVERYLQIIRAIRSRLRPEAMTAATGGSDQNLLTLASRLSLYTLDHTAEIEAPAEEQLWLWVIHACGKAKSLDLDGMEAMIRDLLESFPPARRSILIDVLLGHTSSQAAQAHAVTVRAVTRTIRIATMLLEQGH